MVRILKGSHSFTCTPRVHPLTEWTISFPAEAGTHLPTPEGLKAELALGGWLVTYWNRCPAPGIEPDTDTYLSSNRVRRRLTSLIKANVLTTTLGHQVHISMSVGNEIVSYEVDSHSLSSCQFRNMMSWECLSLWLWTTSLAWMEHCTVSLSIDQFKQHRLKHSCWMI